MTHPDLVAPSSPSQDARPDAGALRLRLEGIVKRYGATLANDQVSLAVAPGEIHGLIGENGAGKSTLMKVAYGMAQPDEGSVYWEDKAVHLSSPAQARALGIGMVFQHFALFDTLTVAENVVLGLDPALPLARDRAELGRRIIETGERYGLPLQPDRHVHELSVGERQRIEIIRALLQEPRLLIMDEPTSVLTPDAVQRLFGTLRQLASEGVSILYISHKLDEVRTLCHRATVLRAGRVTGVCDPQVESVSSLSKLMIGADPPRLQSSRTPPGETVLQVEGLSLPPARPGGRALRDCTLAVRAGEVVGIAGISGQGQNELLDVLAGEDRRAPPGSLRLRGEDAGRWGVHERRARGLAFVPEERLGRGAVPVLGLHLNLLLTQSDPELTRGGMLRLGGLKARAQALIDLCRVRAAGPEAPAGSLSGGNLQKFIVGRALHDAPALMIVAQPTWGVDVGAAADIRGRLLALRDAGGAVLVVSEELDELFELADTLYVMQGGALSAPIPVAQATIERVGALMGGGA